MTLKEEILSRKSSTTKEDLEKIANSPRAKQYSKFLDICERLQTSIDLSDIHCSTCKEVFELIEKHHINISDIVPEEDYNNYKNAILSMKSNRCPSLGRMPDKIYDLNSIEDYIAYTNKQREGRRK